MNDLKQESFSLKSFLVLVHEKNAGYRAPILAYSDKALAWAHFLDMVANYPGDKTALKLFIVGEFDPLSSTPITLYDDFVEIDSDVAFSSDFFDHYLIESVNKYLTDNENSVYTIALKDPSDSSAVLADALREKLKGGLQNGKK